MGLSIRCRYLSLYILGGFCGSLLPCWCDKNAALSSHVAFCTEVLEHGRLVGKRSIVGQVTGIIYSKKRFAVYSDVDGSFPLQQKNVYSDRWKIALGVLGKVTEDFTLDIGCAYHFLERFGFEKLHRWSEWYLGVRSDLLMSPQFYFSWDKERRQWGVELQFHYDFDLFDNDKQWICWENQWGFFKGKYPTGTLKQKYHYMYFETSLFYKHSFTSACKCYAGPTLAYNTGGTRANGVINTATRCSHFFSLQFGLELNF